MFWTGSKTAATPFTVRYEQLTSLLAKAIQQIATITGTE
jgi:hypothetical protein